MLHTFHVARKRRQDIQEEDLRGFKHFKLLLPVLEKLHHHGCARDSAGNRKLHYDQYTALILLYFFNPIVSSLRGIQQTSELNKVQRMLRCPRASLGSLSEAARVFDADLLRGIIGELVDKLPPIQRNTRFDDIKGIITLVDGTLLPVLPKLVAAMWSDKKHKAFKLHTHFELLRGVPTRIDLTAGDTGERRVLKNNLEPDRVYVMDCGYTEFSLFQAIVEIGSSFVCRVYDGTVFEVLEERPVGEEARAGNVLRDITVRFTGDSARRIGLQQPMRLVQLKCTPHQKRGGRPGQGGPCRGETMLIATNLLEVPPDTIALIYKHRWAIETFFRFFKHVLGCRHLISHAVNGIEIQVYLGIIACLLIALWTGRKPTLRTYEMICHYFSGLADEEELLAHIDKLAPQP
jgi:hypothetical protein